MVFGEFKQFWTLASPQIPYNCNKCTSVEINSSEYFRATPWDINLLPFTSDFKGALHAWLDLVVVILRVHHMHDWI